MLNPQKICHQQLVHLPTSTVYCSHFALGNPKSHFQQYYSDILWIIYVISKENKLLLPYPPHLKNVNALPCKMYKFFIFFIFFNPWYGRVAEALRHGLNFSTAWWTMQLISGEKDWKHVSMQKVVTMNICCNVFCMTFHLPHITTSSFHSHQCQPTTGFFQNHQRLEECNIPSVRWKSCVFYKVVQWHFSGVVVGSNSLFSSVTTQIIWSSLRMKNTGTVEKDFFFDFTR